MAMFTSRFVDLRNAAQRAASALNNQSGGTWTKFLSGGNNAPVGSTITKPSDFVLFSQTAVDELFDREAYGQFYGKALNNGTATGRIIQAKRESDYLSSMQQATVLRYNTSRIRHFSATRSRLESLATADIELVWRDVKKK